MYDNSTYEMNDKLNKELLKGEKILWAGQPETSVLFTKIDVFLVPFSFFWFALALCWEVGVIFFIPEIPLRILFGVFGIPFVIIGLYVTFGRFLWKNFTKRNTYYAVTDKRVIIVSDVVYRHVQAEFIDRVPTINKTVRPDGIGTLRFGAVASMVIIAYENTGMDFGTSFHEQNVPTFYDIKNAENVFNLVNEVRSTLNQK